MAAEARQAGRPELASSLKKLRKPSVGAWLANVLVVEQASDVERLIRLGFQLREPKRKLEREDIRRVSVEKSAVVAQLVRDAKSRASRADQAVSAAASEELEATLEAAFADPRAAESLLEGRLGTGLHYSGLGFEEQISTGLPTGTRRSERTPGDSSTAKRIVAQRNLKKASQDAEQADTHLAEAKQATAEAAKQLSRLKSAEARATQQSKAAHARVSAATRRLSQLR
jgi:hypothetical protein